MEDPVRRISSRWVHEGRLVRVRVDNVILPRGTETTYEYVEIKKGSTVIAVEDNLDIWMVDEWKYAIGRNSLEVVSGGIEPDEEPIDTARRELREEVGVTADELIPMGFVDPFTTMLRCPNYLFLARGLTRVPHEHEEGELIKILRVPLREAVNKVLSGEITHGSSAVAILKASAYLASGGSATNR